jgi:glycosyltransferase involved in cell wall biosynthesis
MSRTDLSVIIPTYNRKHDLLRCLDHFHDQSTEARYEVLVIDDGSDDGTETLILERQKFFRFPLSYHKNPGKGPAAARNSGIDLARGEIILFIGDDIFMGCSRFLDYHMKAHQHEYPDPGHALLGYTTWSPALPVTPYMRWLEEGGPQFNYLGLERGHLTDFWHFYTSNISLKRSFIGGDRFDERFPYAAFEDVEFGYRLHLRGLKLVFLKEAIAHHHHPTTLAGSRRRAYLAGRSAAVLERIHPGLFEQVVRKERAAGRRFMDLFYRLALNPLTIPAWHLMARFSEDRFLCKSAFECVYRYHYQRGYRDGAAAGSRPLQA